MYFIGDIHGEFEELTNILARANIRQASIIQVGDFGLGFHPIEKDQSSLNELNNFLRKSDNQLYAIRGNHDNPIFFDGKSSWSNLHLLPDYTVLNVENRSLLLIGGALSIDRTIRKEGKNYWTDEKFIMDEDKISQILISNPKIDIVVTHTAPSFVWPQSYDSIVIKYSLRDDSLISELEAERYLVDKVYDMLKIYNPTSWYYGHFHASHIEVVGRTEFYLLDVMEVVEHL